MNHTLEKLRDLFTRYREQIAYLFFGAVTTAINLATYFALHSVMGMDSDIANVIAWVVAVVAAYVSNRKWVFNSRTTGRAALREFAAFVGARVVTGVMDQAIMHLTVKVLGPKLIAPAYTNLWDNGMKLASNVLVIILNYVFSKLFIFRKKDERPTS